MRQLKTSVFILLLSISLIVQLFLLQSFQLSFIAPNAVLAFVIAMSLFSDYEQIMWNSLFAGLAVDLYSNMFIGFNILFYLLVGFLSKSAASKVPENRGILYCVVATSIAGVLQGILVMFGVIQDVSLIKAAQNILIFVIFTIVITLLWYSLLKYLINLSKSLNFLKAVIK